MDEEKKIEGKVLDLSETSMYDYDVAWEQLSKDMTEAVKNVPSMAVFIPVLAVLLREFLHWMYDKSGTHGTAEKLFKEAREKREARETIFTPDFIMPGKRNGKAND